MCLEHEVLSAYLDGELEPPWDKSIVEHLAGCETCRSRLARMEETRRFLQSESLLDWQAPMERVRRRLLEQRARRPFVLPLWRRYLTVPLPLAAAVAALVLFLAASLSIALWRSNIGTVRITKAPAGATEIQIAAPVGKLETLLKSMDTQDTAQDVITLPKNFHLMPVGQPLMGKEAEFLRKKAW